VLHFAGPKPIVPARDYSKAVAALTGLDDVEAMDLLEPPLARLRQANGARVVSMSSWGCRHQCLVPSIPKRLTPFGVWASARLRRRIFGGGRTHGFQHTQTWQ